MHMQPHIIGKSTLLVVDDKPENLDVLIAYLQESSLRILVAQTGEEALYLAERFTPQLILLDILMPGIDGFETCRRLKEIDATRDIPVIFMTALSETIDKVKGFEVGGVDYITKPLQHEEVLARVNAHLTIRNQQQQLQALNASKDKFFSIISHDLRGPLSSLRDLTKFAVEHLETFTPDKLKEMIELQHNSTENLYKLLENLLTWSRIQRGMIEYHPTPLDLRYLAKQNLELFQPNAAQKQITLHNAIIEPITVYADVNMVNTIIRNLCSNAIKFTPSGGTVTISATQTDDHEVEIAVADTGIGIKPDDLPKLFQIDTKYKRLGTDHEKGTGLGLILCKEFVEKHHGKIWVESTVDQGTTVRYTLPAESSA